MNSSFDKSGMERFSSSEMCCTDEGIPETRRAH